MQFPPETAIKLYFQQLLSLKYVKLPKIFLLAPFGRSLVSQIVLLWGCGQNRRRLRMRHICESAKTKFSRACPAGARVTLQVGCLLFLQCSHHKRRFGRPKTLIEKEGCCRSGQLQTLRVLRANGAPNGRGRYEVFFGTASCKTPRKVTFLLLSCPAWTLALKG